MAAETERIPAGAAPGLALPFAGTLELAVRGAAVPNNDQPVRRYQRNAHPHHWTRILGDVGAWSGLQVT